MMTPKGWFLVSYVFFVHLNMNDVVAQQPQGILPPPRLDKSVDFFDCLRHNQNCFNGGSCDANTGECQCPVDFTNYDCTVQKSSVYQKTSCPGCEHGLCAPDQQRKPMCVCDEYYEGVNCNVPREPVKLFCSDTQMTISYFAYPMSQFEGRIYIEPGEGSPGQSDPHCYFQRRTDSRLNEYWIQVQLDSGCGTGLKQKTEVSADNLLKTDTYTRLIVVQHHPFITSALDESFEVTCSYKEGFYNRDGLVTRISYEEMTSFLSGGLTHENYDAGSLMNMQVLTPEGQQLGNGPIHIGAPLRLNVEMAHNKMFKHRVEGCVATDGIQGGITQPMITAGCIDPSAKGIVYPLRVETFVSIVPFEAFKFSASNQVVFICTVKVCSDFTQCQPYQCDLSGVLAESRQPQQRQRRSLDDTNVGQNVTKLQTQPITISSYESLDSATETNTSGIVLLPAHVQSAGPKLPRIVYNDDCQQNEKTFEVLMYTFGAGSLIAAIWSISMGCLLSPRCQRSRD